MVRTNLNLFDNFNQLTPYAVGFDRVFNRLNDYVSHQQTSTGFPPYNIQKVTDHTYTIEMALAGFSRGPNRLNIVLNINSFLTLATFLNALL